LKISNITQKQTIIFGHIRSCFVSQSGTLTHLKRHFSLPKAALYLTQSGTLTHLKRHFNPPKAALPPHESAVFIHFSPKNMTEYDRK
jgi:hypothetical protein